MLRKKRVRVHVFFPRETYDWGSLKGKATGKQKWPIYYPRSLGTIGFSFFKNSLKRE